MVRLWLSTRREGSFEVIALGGELDLHSSALLTEELLIAVGTLGPSVVLDLSEMTFIDSSGLALLVQLRREAVRAGGNLSLLAPRDPVLRKLQITGLDQRIDIFSTPYSLRGGDGADLSE